MGDFWASQHLWWVHFLEILPSFGVQNDHFLWKWLNFLPLWVGFCKFCNYDGCFFWFNVAGFCARGCTYVAISDQVPPLIIEYLKWKPETSQTTDPEADDQLPIVTRAEDIRSAKWTQPRSNSGQIQGPLSGDCQDVWQFWSSREQVCWSL